MIVTIDGPAGAGKSTLARQLAEKLGFHFLDTGAMYRAVTLAALRANIDLDDEASLQKLLDRLSIRFEGERLLLGGEDVSAEIRTSRVTENVSCVADKANVRQLLVGRQQAIGGQYADLVTEGRDQGTIVFPQAECKIFLTASPEVRAQRRQADLRQQGEEVSLARVLAAQNERDRRDGERAIGPLCQAADAIAIDTDGLSREDVLQRLAALVQQRVPH